MNSSVSHIAIGHLRSTHGYDGKLVCYSELDLTQYINIKEPILLEINNRKVPFFVLNISATKKNHFLISLQQITDVEAAKKWVGTQLVVAISKLLKQPPIDFLVQLSVGFDVKDTKEVSRGVVLHVVDFQTHKVLELKYDNVEIMLPVNPNFLKSIDLESKSIMVAVPEGLLDIYSATEHTPDDGEGD